MCILIIEVVISLFKECEQSILLLVINVLTCFKTFDLFCKNYFRLKAFIA